MSAPPPLHVAAAQKRVLSIQSHVVHGYVGNKCAVFPLQVLGFEVDPINSVQFSNHTGYPSFTGARHGGDHLLDLLKGLEANGLTASYTHLLTGYIGSASLLEAVVEVVGALRRVSPGLTYVCDPVMGDEGRLYVAQDMVDSYRQHIVPLASVMTPNQYEAELLTGIKINGTADALRACEELHARGPHTVVITSMASSARPGHIQLVASTMRAQASAAAADGGSRQAPHKQVVMFIPQIPAYFTGTGDLLSALLLAWLECYPNNLGAAVEAAVGGLQSVLRATAEACGPEAMRAERSAQVCAARELRLVQNQHRLVSPETTLRCEPAAASALEDTAAVTADK